MSFNVDRSEWYDALMFAICRECGKETQFVDGGPRTCTHCEITMTVDQIVEEARAWLNAGYPKLLVQNDGGKVPGGLEPTTSSPEQ